MTGYVVLRKPADGSQDFTVENFHNEFPPDISAALDLETSHQHGIPQPRGDRVQRVRDALSAAGISSDHEQSLQVARILFP